MRNLFQTASYNDMNVIRPQVAEPKVLPDFIKNNKPENFTTMGGVSSNGSFNMAAFGTMQVNNQSKTPVMDFNFLENRPKNPTSSGEGDLIWCSIEVSFISDSFNDELSNCKYS